MALIKKNWVLNSYVDGTPTALVSEESILATVVLANVGGDVTFRAYLWDTVGNVALGTLLAPITLTTNETKVLDFNSFCLIPDQAIYMEVTGAGGSILASGVIDDV